MIYTGFETYINTSENDFARLTKIQSIIDKLLDAVIRGAEKAEYQSFQMDSGQSRIETNFRSLKALREALDGYIMVENRLITKLNRTRTIKLLPARRPTLRNI